MEMKERQRWRSEEDALLCAYVKQYGPREWNLVSQRMNKPLDRDAKSCLERWKNYLKPGIKKGSLTEEEQRLVIELQAKHGNKWKKIAAEIPGRTAKRLGKWWEVFKEKQQRQQQRGSGKVDPIEEGKYDQILQTFAEKLVQKQSPSGPTVTDRVGSICMATSNSFLHSDPPQASQMLPPWLSNLNGSSTIRPPSPSVALTLSHSTVGHMPWLQPSRTDNGLGLGVPHGPVCNADSLMFSELADRWRELEEGHQALLAHKKEAAWRLKRVELQLESEKASRRREKMEEIDSKVRALWEEQKVLLERIDAEYKEQLLSLRRDAEAKEQKLGEQWAARHQRLARFLEQIGYPQRGGSEQTGR